MNLDLLFTNNKEQAISGRYLTLGHIVPLLEKLNTQNQLTVIGHSVLNKPIYKYQLGTGTTKILLWSQMHGNESTTTKALFDFFNFLHSDEQLAQQFLKTFTFYAIPILNPDGAERYTRVNANEIDLNRDSQDLSQPESKILRQAFEDFKPHFCFNLHDQRTIFGVSSTGKPATVSFLAPAFNEARDINDSRLKAINLIAGINLVLQEHIPGQVGRFDDSFNINCIGDTFQNLGVPTVLFEAGHFQDDYDREETRKYIFMALMASFKILSDNDIVDSKLNDYLIIPQNKVAFYDFIYKNIKINYDGIEIITNFAAQYKEELIDGLLCFTAYIVEIGDLNDFFGHIVYDLEESLFIDNQKNIPEINNNANFSLQSGKTFFNGMQVN